MIILLMSYFGCLNHNKNGRYIIQYLGSMTHKLFIDVNMYRVHCTLYLQILTDVFYVFLTKCYRVYSFLALYNDAHKDTTTHSYLNRYIY